MAKIKRKASDLLVLPVLVGAPIYSVVTGEWWAFGAVAGAAAVGSLIIPIDRYYGEATAPVSRLVLALEHLLALGLLVLLVWRAPRLADAPAIHTILWIAIVAGSLAFFARSVVAWRRTGREGTTG